MATTQLFSEELGLDSASSLIKGKLSAQWSLAEHPALRTSEHLRTHLPASSAPIGSAPFSSPAYTKLEIPVLSPQKTNLCFL